MNLVKKKLVFKSTKEGQLGYNYYYNLMREIYNAMTEIDKEKAFKLHESGFILDNNKRFKLFNYNLLIENVKSDNNGFKVSENDTVKLIISGINDVVNLIIKGFIKKQYFTLDGVEFKLEGMEDDNKLRFNNVMLYKTRTPVVESIFDGNNKKVLYLNPFQEEYYSALGNNLLRKYELIYNKKYQGELYFDIENTLSVKKKFITGIKNGYLIGYQDFELFIQADQDMQKVAYYLGVGQNNSIGMGSLSYITGRRC